MKRKEDIMFYHSDPKFTSNEGHIPLVTRYK